MFTSSGPLALASALGINPPKASPMPSSALALVPAPTPAIVAHVVGDGFPTVAACLAEMQRGIADFKKSFDQTITAALRVGHAALTAKTLLPHGKFLPWLEENVQTMSGTWVRVCMRAAQVQDLIATREDRDAIITRAGTVEGVAGLLLEAKKGNAANFDAPEKPAPRRGPQKLKIDRGDSSKERAEDEDTDTGKDANRAAELAKWEARLKVEDERLQKWSNAIAERERNVAMREARLPKPGKVVDVEARALPGETDHTADLKAAKLAADEKARAKAARSAGALVAGKAPASPAGAAGSAAKGKGKGVGAGKGKNAPEIAPGTVASIQQAAAQAVPDTAESVAYKAAQAAAVMGGLRDALRPDQAMDQPHHGHAPEEAM